MYYVGRRCTVTNPYYPFFNSVAVVLLLSYVFFIWLIATSKVVEYPSVWAFLVLVEMDAGLMISNLYFGGHGSGFLSFFNFATTTLILVKWVFWFPKVEIP